MEYKTGLWKKQSKNGTTYVSGKIKIEENEYYISLFNNDKKGNDKAPDFNIILRPVEKKIEDSQIFEDFGKDIEIGEDDMPF